MLASLPLRNQFIMKKPVLISLLLGIVFLAACGGNSNNATSKGSPEVKKGVDPIPDNEIAVIELENSAAYGTIKIELYSNIAPKMVEQFKKLVSDHFYDGTAIHRIDPNLGIIQGGDPNTKGGNPATWGMGNSKYPNAPAEFSDLPYERGTLGAARTSDINTANCQWFITLKRQPIFDKRYTVFGRVIDGIKNAEVIMNAPIQKRDCTPNDQDPACSRPADKVMIKFVTLQPRAGLAAP